jgi:hypothetical protein
MWGMAMHTCLQATHRISQPCQHPGPEGWVVHVTQPWATCHEQPRATSGYNTTAITYWVRRPGGLGIGPTHVVVNGNPWTVPDANLRLPAPGLRTDGPVRPRKSALEVQAEAAKRKVMVYSMFMCTWPVRSRVHQCSSVTGIICATHEVVHGALRHAPAVQVTGSSPSSCRTAYGVSPHHLARDDCAPYHPCPRLLPKSPLPLFPLPAPLPGRRWMDFWISVSPPLLWRPKAA